MRPIALHGPNATHLAFVPADRENRADVAEEDDDDEDDDEDEEEEGDEVPVAARALSKLSLVRRQSRGLIANSSISGGSGARGLDLPGGH